MPRGRPKGSYPIEERFWKHVMPEPNSGCWLWTGALQEGGYSKFREGPGKKSIYGHRLSYELFNGPIPEGLTIDHKCRVRSCVNPAHLEAVTMRENVLRGTSIMAENAKKTHCKRGHALDAENTEIRKNGQRACRACIKEAYVRRRDSGELSAYKQRRREVAGSING